eukprot:5043401-Pyramimonas_sp.AAC.1
MSPNSRALVSISWLAPPWRSWYSTGGPRVSRSRAADARLNARVHDFMLSANSGCSGCRPSTSRSST